MSRLFVALFCGIALVFMSVGAFMAFDQQRKITTYVPADATIVSGEVQRRESSGGSGSNRRTSVSYGPAVTYRYDVGGQSYTSDDLRPTGTETGSQSWAEGVVGRFPPGSRQTIWHDPRDPAKSFLLREWSFTPYLFVLAPMLHLSIGLGVGLLTRWGRGRAAPLVPRAGGWFELPAGMTTGQKLRGWAIIAAVWYGVGLLTGGHYFAVADPPYGNAPMIVLAIYAAVGLLSVFMTLYYLRLRGNASDARAFVDRSDARCGEPITIRVEQSLSPDILVEELKVGLVCTASTREQRGSKTSYSSHERCAVWETLATNTMPRRGAPLEAKHTFTLRWHDPPTSPADQKEYPRHAWRVEVRTKLANSPDYRGSFPIAIAAGTRPPGAVDEEDEDEDEDEDREDEEERDARAEDDVAAT
jgi:hypothetical protein